MKPAPVRPAELIAALLNIDDNMTASWWGIMWQWDNDGWPVWEWGQSVCVVKGCTIELD
jgi:hypothetical protein